MASPKSKAGVRKSPGRQKRAVTKATRTTSLFVGPDTSQPKGAAGFKFRISDNAYQALTSRPERVRALLRDYAKAILKSRTAGRAVSFRVEVDPAGAAVVTPVEDNAATTAEMRETSEPADPALADALAAARQRGRLRAAEILSDSDMLSAEDFARLLGTSRVTVNTKRQSGQLLGLDGAKRGFRFPVWQIDAEGKPYGELVALHAQLGGPWAVYRFLVQPHGELDGLTGRQALERGKNKALLAAAESVGRDFR